ncbi:MBL fold metallo-hydrolase [Pyrofollis japonicus]|uniref:MBL fold metallo-hydrolase n=1 Tax=Pyrofollis japonicus TaxID=3060460 RepID=UPI00295B9CD8|nr:MBL fold metallo-hydrolase [Pyrofollis japonicus]BEP18457.1 MBL fold metallo-hydrolase [Pyrofollis japonicus]
MAAKPRRLGDRTWALPGSPNTVIVGLGNGSAMIIDPGIGDDRSSLISASLEKLGLRATVIALTHGHTDHLAAAPPLVSESVQVLAHKYCVPLVESLETRFSIVYGGVISKSLASMPPITLRVSRAYWWGEEIASGVKTIDLRGHSPGHSGIVIEDDKVIAAGDAILGEKVLARFGIPFALNLREWKESLQVLMELAESGYKIVPGHGPIVEGGRAKAMIEANIAAVDKVRNYVLETIRSHHPITIDKLAVIATRDLSAAEPTPRQVLLNRTALVSVVAWLEEEGLVEPVTTDEGVAWKPRG